MRVVVVSVGDELLAGDVTDTNAAWLATRLTERGATVARMLTLPDDEAVLATEIRAASDEYDAVVVTGGLGPTHDDLTMAGVAAAFDREVAEHDAVVEWFEERGSYAASELAAGTTHLPVGARMLPNEVGVAPGAVVENVYVFPGVPAEMKDMFASVADEFEGTRRTVAFVHADEPESALIGRFEEVRERFDVQVGSYPGETVRIKLQSENPDAVADAEAWLRERVETVAEPE